MHYTEFYCKIQIFLHQDTDFTQKNYGRSDIGLQYRPTHTWNKIVMQHTFFPNKFRTSIFLNLTCKQFWPTCSLWVVVSLSEFLGWRFVRSFLSFSSTVRVLLSHRLGQVCIFGTTGDIPCPSVLSNKVAGQSQFSPPFDHLFRTIRSFFFPSRSWHLSLPLSNQLLSLLSSFLWSILWTVHSFTSNSTSS